MVSAKDTRLAILNARITVAMMRADLLLKRFDPNQPRVPAGTATGGQWVQITRPIDKRIQSPEPTDQRIRLAGLRRLTEDECEELYKKDTFHCNMVGLASCHQQAMFRYSDCLSGKTIRPLSY